jgi:hypothetical protein
MSRARVSTPSAGSTSRQIAPIVLTFVGLTLTGCGGASQYVDTEITYWGQFQRAEGGPLVAGVNRLPAPVREGFCYRVIIASQGEGESQLAFQSEIDRDSVGFPIHRIQPRSGAQAGASLAVFGFCSQGSGTIQLRATIPGDGHGILLEAPFGALDPSQGPDVQAARQWIAGQAQRRSQEEQRRRQEDLQRRMVEFAESVTPQMRQQLDAVLRERGRYTDTLITEIRAGTQMEEALILEPDRCYVFAVVGYETTEINANVMFSRIRNATERSDLGDGISYTVCTAPHGPIQEVNFTIEARVPPNAPHPPVFGARVAFRRPSTNERRAADLEWLRNDPEARIEE